jgi:hypothetical protein
MREPRRRTYLASMKNSSTALTARPLMVGRATDAQVQRDRYAEDFLR